MNLAINRNKITSAVMAVTLMLTSLSGAILPARAFAATTTSTPKVSFTFDDSLQSSYTLAAPSLAKYGLAGTDYVITNCVGMTTTPNTCPADNSKAYMSWDQITALQNTYHWEIGSHTLNHPLTAAVDNPTLTDAQLDSEMSGSQAALAAHGFNATDYASPYGDYDSRSLATTAKYYATHRAFQDYTQPADATEVTNTFPYYSPRSSYPYNDYLLTVEAVQGNVPVATVEKSIDTAKANGQWLILVFHNITAGTASTSEADYQYSAAQLEQIAAYVQTSGVAVTNVSGGIASGYNIMNNGGFNNGIADGWSTDSPTTILADKQSTSLAGHGSYDGTATGPMNSISLKGSTTDTHLFSPYVLLQPAPHILSRTS
jgi:peptidoglycan/xylan/chitin deacetylase (PgdA/CDA1 family)